MTREQFLKFFEENNEYKNTLSVSGVTLTEEQITELVEYNREQKRKLYEIIKNANTVEEISTAMREACDASLNKLEEVSKELYEASTSIFSRKEILDMCDASAQSVIL